MSKKTTISQADKDLFRETVKKQPPQDKDKGAIPSSKESRQPKSRPTLTQRTIEPTSSFSVGPEDTLFYTSPGLQQKTIKKLKQGAFDIEANLDLHHNTIEQAARALQTFLEQCLQQSLRMVCIVHGKGHRSENKLPILKNQVNLWLREYPEVLAFTSAKPKDGGTGALYVLLKRV